jgi:hypothetical protein
MRRARTIDRSWLYTCAVPVSVQCANAQLPSFGGNLLPQKTAFVQVLSIHAKHAWSQSHQTKHPHSHTRLCALVEHPKLLLLLLLRGFRQQLRLWLLQLRLELLLLLLLDVLLLLAPAPPHSSLSLPLHHTRCPPPLSPPLSTLPSPQPDPAIGIPPALRLKPL